MYNSSARYDDNGFMRLSAFPQYVTNDQREHYFKTLIDGDLSVILIDEDRQDSIAVRFNCSFDDSLEQKQCLYWRDSKWCYRAVLHRKL